MDAYRWFVQAGQHQLAHDIAVEFLAPEAVIMSDMTLLEDLFDALDPSAVSGWHEKGNVSTLALSFSLAHASCQFARFAAVPRVCTL